MGKIRFDTQQVHARRFGEPIADVEDIVGHIALRESWERGQKEAIHAVDVGGSIDSIE